MNDGSIIGSYEKAPRSGYAIKIAVAYPPNFREITQAFPKVRGMHGVIFTYGDTIFNPSGIDITPSLLAHESVHSKRQGADPQSWWAKYLTDEQFRFLEELIAHRVEYRIASHGQGRRDRRVLLAHIAGRLAGPLYSHMVNRDEAKKLILEEIDGPKRPSGPYTHRPVA
jgi:hypothetical protein